MNATGIEGAPRRVYKQTRRASTRIGMEFSGNLGELDAYYIERRDIQTQNGKLHADVWRLSKEENTAEEIDKIKTQIRENCVRIRTLNHLIDKKRLECMGL